MKASGLLLLLAALSSCDEGKGIPRYANAAQLAQIRYEMARQVNLDTLANARALWAQRAPSCRTYYYDRSNSSAQFIEKTTVQIEDGAPVWRWYFKATGGSQPGNLIEQWTERDAELGTHADGYPAQTIDRLQDECEAIVRGATYPEFVTLTVDADGVPRSCRMPDDICFDRCGHGIDLSVFACKRIEPPTSTDGGTD